MFCRLGKSYTELTQLLITKKYNIDNKKICKLLLLSKNYTGYNIMLEQKTRTLCRQKVPDKEKGIIVFTHTTLRNIYARKKLWNMRKYKNNCGFEEYHVTQLC